jgi:putative oxidoreductase
MGTRGNSSPFARCIGAARNVLDRAAFVAPLATRIVIGLAFVQTGYGKWHNFPRIVQFFASLGIPVPTASAALVSTLELVGGPLLILGLGTRVFAAVLSTSMVVALGTADRQTFLASWSPASETSPTDVTSFTFLLFLLWLVLAGPGKASLDHLITRLRGGGRRKLPDAG